jgi:hypothetical protein
LDPGEIGESIDNFLPPFESPILVARETAFDVGFDVDTASIFPVFLFFFEVKIDFSGRDFVILPVNSLGVRGLQIVDIGPVTRIVPNPIAPLVSILGNLIVTLKDFIPLDKSPIPYHERLLDLLVCTLDG